MRQAEQVSPPLKDGFRPPRHLIRLPVRAPSHQIHLHRRSCRRPALHQSCRRQPPDGRLRQPREPRDHLTALLGETKAATFDCSKAKIHAASKGSDAT